MPTQGQLYRFPSYWQSPEVGEFKLNCNGMITSGGESTYGGVLWDEKGKVKLSYVSNLSMCLVLYTKFWAILNGIRIM